MPAPGLVSHCDIACAPARAVMEPPDTGCLGGREAHAQVPWAANGALLFELALFDTLSIGVRAPIALTHVERGDTSTLVTRTDGGFGDLALVVSGTLLPVGATHFGWQLATTLR